MADPKALVDAGRLTDAIAELNQAVKARPGDGSLRVFLFELLCLLGDLERAGKQLDVISTQTVDAGSELTVQIYRGLLAGEAKRRDVFHGVALPKFVTPPPPHVERYAVLLKKLQTAPEEAFALLEQAEDESPAVGGERETGRFSELRDADDRVSGVLEVLFGSDYLWVPLSQVVRLEVVPPKRLRELMWAQVRLEVIGQPMGEVFVPSLYVDSYQYANEQVKLGRMTEWEAIGDRMVVGAGQRLFLVDGEEVPLLALGKITFAAPQPATAPAS